MDERKQILLEEYKLTLDAAIYEGTLYWQRFNVMFVVNSAILAFLGFIVSSSTENIHKAETAWLIVAICTIGLIASLGLVFMNLRAQMFYKYWWDHLGEIEKNGLEEITLKRGINEYSKRHSFIRQTPVLNLSHIIPISFAVIYVVVPVVFYSGEVVTMNVHFWTLYLVMVIAIVSFLLGLAYFSHRRRETR